MPRTYEPIASKTLGTAAASLTFSDIPSTFTDLVLVEAISFSVGSNQSLMSFDSSSLYSSTNVHGTGSAVGSQRFTAGSTIGSTPGNSLSGTTPIVIVRQIMSYSNSNVHKTILQSSSDSSAIVMRVVGLWRSTTAVTSITLATVTGNYAAGSTFSLYGIRAA